MSKTHLEHCPTVFTCESPSIIQSASHMDHAPSLIVSSHPSAITCSQPLLRVATATHTLPEAPVAQIRADVWNAEPASANHIDHLLVCLCGHDFLSPRGLSLRRPERPGLIRQLGKVCVGAHVHFQVAGVFCCCFKGHARLKKNQLDEISLSLSLCVPVCLVRSRT